MDTRGYCPVPTKVPSCQKSIPVRRQSILPLTASFCKCNDGSDKAGVEGFPKLSKSIPSQIRIRPVSVIA